MVKGCNFGQVIEALKEGKQASREGWNGKGQYIELAMNISYKTNNVERVAVQHYDIGSSAICFVGNRGRQVGWLASQADMLAEDWMIFD